MSIYLSIRVKPKAVWTDGSPVFGSRETKAHGLSFGAGRWVPA